jgi:hypothetical protein
MLSLSRLVSADSLGGKKKILPRISGDRATKKGSCVLLSQVDSRADSPPWRIAGTNSPHIFFLSSLPCLFRATLQEQLFFSITGIKQNSSLPRDRSLASTHLDSTVKARMFLSLCGNACTVSSVDLLPFLASTRCSEPCGNYSDLHPSMVDSCSVRPGRLPPAHAFLGISSLGSCSLSTAPCSFCS